MRFKLHQTFDANHQIGCFRISVSKYDGPLGLSLPEHLLVDLSRPEKDWKPEKKKLLLAQFERDDMELTRLKQAVVDVSKPLVVKPEIAKLRDKLARVSQPVAPDAVLARLEKDVAMSATQLENKRLTAAQDLAWALINSPSFLFNR